MNVLCTVMYVPLPAWASTSNALDNPAQINKGWFVDTVNHSLHETRNFAKNSYHSSCTMNQLKICRRHVWEGSAACVYVNIHVLELGVGMDTPLRKVK